MNLVDRIRAAASFGAAIAVIRKAHDFCVEDAADLLNLSPQDMRRIEFGTSPGAPGIVGQLRTAFGLNEEDCNALEEKRKRNLLKMVGGCEECSSGESSRMHVGAGARFDCVHAARCVDRIAREAPLAKQAHCPAKCVHRRDYTREEMRKEAVLQGKDFHANPRWYGKEAKVRRTPRKFRKAVRSRARAQ